MPTFFELTLDYQLELAKRQIFHVVKQLFFFNYILCQFESDCYQIF